MEYSLSCHHGVILILDYLPLQQYLNDRDVYDDDEFYHQLDRQLQHDANGH